mmetsp:Transcript_22382/g.70106  ORF Transcript_22382/g.70106 Transcript_22382/m.70106 type:complete len:85 (-) Transcript_22382:996-1250(-)
MAQQQAVTTTQQAPLQVRPPEMGLMSLDDVKMLGLACLVGFAVYELIRGSVDGSSLKAYSAGGVLVAAYVLAKRLKAHQDKKLR